MKHKQSLKDKAIAKFRKEFVASASWRKDNSDYLVPVHQKDVEQFISQLVDDTYKAGIKDERKRSEKEFLNPLKRKIRNSL